MRTTHTLKSLRLSKNLTRRALSKKINIPESTLGCWETAINQPNAQNLCKLREFYDFKGDMLHVWENTVASNGISIPDSLLTDSDN